MLSPRWRKVRRDLWLHKARTSLVVLAISIGIIGAGAVLDTWSLLRRVTRGEYDASNAASATLRLDATASADSADSIDAALLDRALAVPAVAEVQARRVVTASAQVDGTWRTAVLFAYQDFAAIRIGVVKPEQGAWPPADGAIVVESSSVDFAGTAVGEALTLQIGGGAPLALPVTGIARDVGLAPGWMEHVVYGFVTRETLARLGAPSLLDELQVVVAPAARRDRDAVRRIAYAVKAAVESNGGRVSSVDVPVPGRHIHAAQIDSLLFTQGAFGMLALVLSGLLVVNLITAMLAGQVREIGVMKAIGARGGQLAVMYLGLAFALGLVACAIGLPVAALIGRAYAKFTADMLNFSIAGFAIPRPVFLLQLAVGALLPVVAAAIPIWRGCRMSVAEALRDFGLAGLAGRAARNPARGRLVRLGGVTRPLLLSLRNAFRRRQRMALTLATLATGGAVYLGALNLRIAVAGSIDLLYSAQRFDMTLRFARPYPFARLESAVSGVAGVERAEAWTGARATLNRADGTQGNRFTISAPPIASRLLALRPEQGRWLRAGDTNALVVNRSLLADAPEMAVGEEVTLMIAGRPTRWQVVGVDDAGPSPSAYASRDAVAAIVGEGLASTVVIAAAQKGPAAQRELIQRLRAEVADAGFEVASSSLLREQRKVTEDHLLMVAGFLGIMGQLMIVVGGLGLASTMSLAVLERTREIGVLRAIGARHRAILGMIQVEGLVIALLSWALAIPLSLPMSVLLGRAFGRIMFRVPVSLVPHTTGVLRWLVVVVVVSLVASAWPAWRATRVTTAAALSYE